LTRALALLAILAGLSAGRIALAGEPTRCLDGLCVDGYIQADAVIADQASQDEISPTGAPENTDRFLVRRAFLRALARRDNLGAVLQLDADTVDGARVRPVNAEVFAEGRLGEVAGRAALGLIKIPFGREVPEGDQDRFFLERTSAARAFFPGVWDAGARVEAAWGPLRLAAAVMNGDPLGEKAYPGLDANGAKDLLGRLGVETRVGPLTIVAGVSALDGTGFHPGTPATKDTLVWRDVNEDGIVQITEIQIIPGAAATPSANFGRFAIGADLQLSLELPTGMTVVSAEAVLAQDLDRGIFVADPVSAGRDLRESGWNVQLVQDVTRWAQVGVRYDYYQPDRDADQQLGATLVPADERIATFAAAAAFRASATTRLLLEYDHQWNALGIGKNGQPTTLGSDALTLRGQVIF
jgi:hypothetical protein